MSGAQSLFAGRRPLGSLAVEADKSILCMTRVFFLSDVNSEMLVVLLGNNVFLCLVLSLGCLPFVLVCLELERTEQANIFPVFHTQTGKVSIHCRALEGESMNDRDTCSRKNIVVWLTKFASSRLAENCSFQSTKYLLVIHERLKWRRSTNVKFCL